MKRMPKLGFGMLFLLTAFAAGGDRRNPQTPATPGEPPPTPEIFLPGVVSTGHGERCAVLSPSGEEFYFALWGPPHSMALRTRIEEDAWTAPGIAPFYDGYDSEFTMSPDGNLLLLSSNRPDQGVGPPVDQFRIWVRRRVQEGWSEPSLLVPFPGGHPSLARNGDLFFFGDGPGGNNTSDIFISVFEDGEYGAPQSLGTGVNTEGDEADPFIAPDGSFLIFARRGEVGSWDLFVSFRRPDGRWDTAKNLGPTVNSGAAEITPSLSPDGRILFFASNRTAPRKTDTPLLSLEEKLEIMDGPGNGETDIYWVEAQVIHRLK